MENTKDSKQLLDELKTLLEVRKNLIGVDKINGVIADKAEEFVKTLYTEIDDEVKKTFEPSVVPKKSEMPCNCVKENSFQSVIGRAVKHIEENLSNEKDLAAIVIVPLADLLADV